MEQIKKKSRAGKIILWVTAGLLVLVIAVTGIAYGVFFNEVNAVVSFKKIDENVYYMEYKNNYYFDEFLEVGASSDTELISFMSKKLLKGLPIEISMPDFGCSTFTAQTAVDTGDRLFARNYDFEYSPILITRTSPKNGYKSIATTDMKAIGFAIDSLPAGLMDKFLCLAAPYAPFDGVNEKGVAISVNMVKGEPANQDTDKIPFTTTTLIRLVLDKADSVEKALELIANYEMHDSTGGPFHFQIADRNGDSAIVEYIENEMQVTRIAATDSYQAMTNFVVYGSPADDFGRDRFDIITAELDETNGILTEAEAVELLEAARYIGNPEDLEDDNVHTMWSNVFNLTKSTMTFYSYTDYANPISFSV